METEGYSQLIQKAQAGDRDAMGRLLSLVRPHLERVARRYADPDDAAQSTADLIQEAWLQAWKGLGQFVGSHDEVQTAATFRSWTAEIVRNVGRLARRSRSTLKRGGGRRGIPLSPAGSVAGSAGGAADPAASGSTPSGRLHAEEEAQRIQLALASIENDSERDIVRLRIFEGLNMRQVAAHLGLTYEQARERYHRAIRRVGRELKRLSGD